MFRPLVLLLLLAFFAHHVPQTRGQNSSLAASVPYEAHLVGLFTGSSELPIYHNLIKPALEMAAEEAERRYPLIKFRVSVRKGLKTCEKNVAGALAAEEFYGRKVDAFIGPACSVALQTVARMASYWNVPLFTAGGIAAEFADKTIYSTLTRLSFSMGSYRASFCCMHNNWSFYRAKTELATSLSGFSGTLNGITCH